MKNLKDFSEEMIEKMIDNVISSSMINDYEFSYDGDFYWCDDCDDNTIEICNTSVNDNLICVTLQFNPATNRMHIEGVDIIEEDAEDGEYLTYAEWKKYIKKFNA